MEAPHGIGHAEPPFVGSRRNTLIPGGIGFGGGGGPSGGPQGSVRGGRFDFDDGGSYLGGWEDGKAHGFGVCTGPRGQGEYAGSWHLGFEISGVYTWPSGNNFIGQWQNGKRHGLGVETRGRWIYRGEWTQGLKGRYGTRSSLTTTARYEGTWANGLQDGYGTETYADSGIYQGQFQRGMRHGYGIRKSAPYGAASMQKVPGPLVKSTSTASLHSDAEDPTAERDERMEYNRGGFVLKVHNDETAAAAQDAARRHSSSSSKVRSLKKMVTSGFRLRRQRSTSDMEHPDEHTGSLRSANSLTSLGNSDQPSSIGMASERAESVSSFVSNDEILDANVTESYLGEWKNDKRSGFGVAERSDGTKYEGEWYNNKRQGYGATTFKDGSKEEGKYKNNFLISSFARRRQLLVVRANKIRERVDQAVSAAVRASQIAMQKAEIAITRTATAHSKAEQADTCAVQAKDDAEIARLFAKQFAPDASLSPQGMLSSQPYSATFSTSAMLQRQNGIRLGSFSHGNQYMPPPNATMFGGAGLPPPSPSVYASSSSFGTSPSSSPFADQQRMQQQQHYNALKPGSAAFSSYHLDPNSPSAPRGSMPNSQQQQQRSVTPQAYMSSQAMVDGDYSQSSQQYDGTATAPPSPQYASLIERPQYLPRQRSEGGWNSSASGNHLAIPDGGGGGLSRSPRQLSIRGSIRRLRDHSSNPMDAATSAAAAAATRSAGGANQSNSIPYQQQEQYSAVASANNLPTVVSANSQALPNGHAGGGGGGDQYSMASMSKPRQSNNTSSAFTYDFDQQQQPGHQNFNDSSTVASSSVAPNNNNNNSGSSGYSSYASSTTTMQQPSHGFKNASTPSTGRGPSALQHEPVTNTASGSGSMSRSTSRFDVTSTTGSNTGSNTLSGATPRSARPRQRSIFVGPASAEARPTRSSSAKRGSLPEVAAAVNSIAAFRAAAGYGGATAAMADGGTMLPQVSPALAREVVSSLSIDRREQLRRQAEEEERRKQNPLLYAFHPRILDWLNRYKFIIFGVLFNIITAYVFYDLLIRRNP